MTLVTALIKDPTGTPYVNAPVECSFVSNAAPGSNQYYSVGGSPFQQQASAVTDSFGNLTISLTGNDTITPAGSAWSFSVMNTARTVGFTTTITITGASQVVSAALQAAAATLPSLFGNITVNNVTANSVTTSALSRDCRIDGTIDLTGVSDASGVINTCIANAVTAQESNIYLPCGKILLRNALNMTNRPGLRLHGCSATFQISQQAPVAGVGQTILLCDTGGVCLDTTGSGSIEVDHLYMYSNYTGATNPSTIGILQGRDNAGGGGAANPFCFQQNWWIHDVNFVDWSGTINTTANGGRGYIGFYNDGAEDGIYSNNAIHSATPIVLTSTNVASVSSPYQTLGTGCPVTMTMVFFWANYTDSGSSTKANIEADTTNNMFVYSHQFSGGSCGIKFEGASTVRWSVQGAMESLVLPAYEICTSVNIAESSFFIYTNGATAFMNPTANNLTFTNNKFLFNSDVAIQAITNTATGIIFKGGEMTVSGNGSYSNTTLQGTMLNLPTFTAAQIINNFSSTSVYQANTTSGIAFQGPIFPTNVSAGATAQVGFAGDIAAVRNGTNGVFWFGSNGVNEIDYGVNTAGVFTAVGGPWSAPSYRSNTNCLLGGAAGTTSPAACAAAPTGRVAIPASQTTYTVNTTAVTANSTVIVQQTTDNSGLPSSPACNAGATTPIQSVRSAGTSFTFTLTSVASVTCFNYWIIN